MDQESTQILVVEDEPIVALDLQQRLERMGYRVPHVVATGEAAIATASRESPQLVLMDISLVGAMDGVEAAEQIGIRVRTIRDYGNRTVAEHAVALMFASARRLAAMDGAIRGGVWETLDGIELEHKTLGVVGTGGIGKEMVRLGHALGMKVLAWNRSGVAADLPCEECALDDLMAGSDVVSLHLSLNDETEQIIDARRIALMRPQSLLINTARGGVIDEAALITALKEAKIAHAGLDVFAAEPLPEGHPFLDMANVTLTSHAGFMTREASARLLQMALEIMREELAA